MRNDRSSSKELRKRIGAMLLSLMVAVSMMPVFAFAEEVPTADGTDAVNGSISEEYQPEADNASADNQPGAGEQTEADDDASLSGQDADKSGEPEVEDAEPEEEDEAEFGMELVTSDVELPESDELLGTYIDKQISDETGVSQSAPSGSRMLKKSAKLASRRSILNANEQAAYDSLKQQIEKIASGGTNKAFATAPLNDDIDYQVVMNALMADLPYEFYWYDKTIGYMYGTESGYPGKEVFYFSVSKDYWDTAVTKYGVKYGLDTSKTKATKEAVDNVSEIINEFADKSDLDKLYGFRNRICEYATYNNAAVTRSNQFYDGINTNPFYGDPWQLIYVFDDDASTNVVCEGYSKAFQYLCNRAEFSNDEIECYTVGGSLWSGTTDKGGHMWNIIHMDNGGNYIADITNCDNGSFAVDTFFLKGYSSGNISQGYRFSYLTYVYDDESYGGYLDKKEVFHKGLYTEEELTLADTDYNTGTPDVTHIPAKAATCTTLGNIECWMRLGGYYSDEACHSRLTYGQTVLRDSHGWSAWKTTKAATCTAKGTQQRTCSKCKKTETRTLAALGHTWSKKTTLDTYVYTCTRCKAKKTVSRVVVDLPAVSIKKPSRAKASFTAKWKKVSKKNRNKIGGIEIQYSTRKDFAASYVVTTAKKTATSKKFKKLARKTTYYVRVRSYRWVSGKKHVSKWSAAKSVKTK